MPSLEELVKGSEELVRAIPSAPDNAETYSAIIAELSVYSAMAATYTAGSKDTQTQKKLYGNIGIGYAMLAERAKKDGNEMLQSYLTMLANLYLKAAGAEKSTAFDQSYSREKNQYKKAA